MSEKRITITLTNLLSQGIRTKNVPYVDPDALRADINSFMQEVGYHHDVENIALSLAPEWSETDEELETLFNIERGLSC